MSPQQTHRTPLLSFTSLSSAILLAWMTSAVAQENSSPMAGPPANQAAASAALQWPEPAYEQPAQITVRGASSRSALADPASFNMSAASVLNGLLPPGISLRAGDGEGTLLNMMPEPQGSQSGASEMMPEGSGADNGMDAEQVDAMQAAPGDAVQKWILHYPVNFQNIPVSHYADVVSFIGVDGQLQYLRKRNLPNSVDATVPTVEAAAARDVAVADAGEWAKAAVVEGPVTEIWVNPDGSGKLAYRIELTSNDLSNPNARRYWIAAVGQPSVLFWENLVTHTHNGAVTGTVWTKSGLATSPTAGMPMASVTVNRSTGGSVLTGDNGLYAFPAGSGSATLSATLSGPNSVIDNVAGAEISRSKAGTPSDPVDLGFNATGEDEMAQTSAFYWTNRTFELAKDILAPADLPNLPTRVNVAGSCNAFWNGSSINFFKAGGGCPNMAYASVVAHEYGHGIDARKGGIAHGGYSEGFGDAISILLLRKSCVGEDFFGAGTCLRDAADLIMWPPAPADGVHAQGRRYAGFTWELTQQLKKNYGEDTGFGIARQLVLAASKANPASIPDAVLLSFIADDNDGNLANGTPHFKELAAAADSRNLPRPANPSIGQRRMGFAWANDPSAASYTPSATYSFNSGGGAITATRGGVGSYSITFAGLGGNGTAGGNVQVTSYGAGGEHCKVASWGSSSANFAANIRCFSASGSPVDSRYTIMVNWP